MRSRKAQETGSQAAMVIAILTLLMIFYILFLPPAERDALLGDGPSEVGPGPSEPSGVTEYRGENILQVNPGKIDYQALSTYEYDIPSFSLYKTENSQVITESDDFYVKSGWFESKDKSITFNLDKDKVRDVSLSATLREYDGILTITVNGKEVYDYEASSLNIGPISVEPAILKEGTNTITLSVSSVGLKFWTVNEYYFENVKLTGTIVDESMSSSESSFYISPEEGKNIEKASLKFNPNCNPNHVGILKAYINDREIFRGVPDCGILNKVSISPSNIYTGKNSVSFTTEQGSYVIDLITVETELSEVQEPIYYFDLDSKLFYEKEEEINRCGEIDGVCPNDCNEDMDRDCCFEYYDEAYWCDLKTEYIDDRCVGHVDTGTCERCKSGYEDENGRAPEACKGLCGDDKDNRCPAGCDPNYDQDCCFEQQGNQYWCDDLPVTGVDYTCVDSVTYDSCSYCVSGYDGERGDPDCDYTEDSRKTNELKSADILLEIKFTESGERKEARMYVNGYETGFETRDDRYTRNINDFVEPGTNSIRIVPKSDLDIRQINVDIE
ncbi:MAG: hypothetical protein R6V53_01900 [Candidatus Woesearchaeota archaeon]